MIHSRSCPCCHAHVTRRGILIGVAASGVLIAARPFDVLAAEGNYEAMVLACIDPRMQEPVRQYLAARGLTGQYSHFVIAGAAIGVVAEVFNHWHKAFWDNLAASIQLHNIKKVIAIDHRDCGAAKIAYGADAVGSPTAETATHRMAMAEFRNQVGTRFPQLGVETGLMALDGEMEMFS